MTDAELDLLMRDVLLDSLKLDDAAVPDSQNTSGNHSWNRR